MALSTAARRTDWSRASILSAAGRRLADWKSSIAPPCAPWERASYMRLQNVRLTPAIPDSYARSGKRVTDCLVASSLPVESNPSKPAASTGRMTSACYSQAVCSNFENACSTRRGSPPAERNASISSASRRRVRVEPVSDRRIVRVRHPVHVTYLPAVVGHHPQLSVSVTSHSRGVLPRVGVVPPGWASCCCCRADRDGWPGAVRDGWARRARLWRGRRRPLRSPACS